MGPYQECAVYGELVRHLRDQCVVKISELDPNRDAAAARAWADQVIREWLLTPHEDMHGSSPSEIIWRERKGEPNVVPPDHADDMFFCDCPVCQTMKEMELEGGWHWHYDEGGFPLLEEYDTVGANLYYAEEMKRMEEYKERNPSEFKPSTPEEFIEAMKRLTDDDDYRELFEENTDEDKDEG